MRLALPVAALPWLFVPALAHAQRLGGGGDLNISLGRIVAALLLCLVVAGAAALILKRGGGRIDVTAFRSMFARSIATRRIEIIESRRVSQHADLALVRCDGQEYLILCSAQQQQLLRQSPLDGAVTAPEAS